MSNNSGWDEEPVVYDWTRSWEEHRRERELRRERRGFIDIPVIPNDIVTANFTRYLEDGVGDGEEPLGVWAVNRKFWICHNCGCFGYKINETFNPLFKCYGCRSRNVTVVRSGDLSMLIRHHPVGTNMENIYRDRQENNRRRRRARREESAVQNT